jgi:hypothetical protein
VHNQTRLLAFLALGLILILLVVALVLVLWAALQARVLRHLLLVLRSRPSRWLASGVDLVLLGRQGRVVY